MGSLPWMVLESPSGSALGSRVWLEAVHFSKLIEAGQSSVEVIEVVKGDFDSDDFGASLIQVLMILEKVFHLLRERQRWLSREFLGVLILKVIDERWVVGDRDSSICLDRNETIDLSLELGSCRYLLRLS